MRLMLVDDNDAVVTAWRKSFARFPEIGILCGDTVGVASNTLVSAANSFGIMDGGLDQRYLDFFGLEIQARAQSAIHARPEGNFPVGAALVVRTSQVRVPFLIVAPTMFEPVPVPADHSYRAFRAVLRAATASSAITDVFCPGLATGIGQVPPEDAAEAMAAAYSDWLGQIPKRG